MTAGPKHSWLEKGTEPVLSAEDFVLTDPDTPPGALEPESHAALMTRLYREHNQALIRFLLTRVDSRQEAQDVAHEAYVRLLQLDQHGAVSYLSAYLFRTAANIAIDRIRRGRRLQRINQSLQATEETYATPERAVATRQELEIIARSLDQLPTKCRQAFYLYRVHEMSLDEIAHELRIGKRMVHIYLQRAIVHCRTSLDALPMTEKSKHR